jgi:hypothetical protein
MGGKDKIEKKRAKKDAPLVFLKALALCFSRDPLVFLSDPL